MFNYIHHPLLKWLEYLYHSFIMYLISISYWKIDFIFIFYFENYFKNYKS